MEYQLHVVFLVLMFCVVCIRLGTAAPYSTPPPDSVFDLVDDKDVDLADQVVNILGLAEVLINMGYMEMEPGYEATDLNKTEMNTQLANFQRNAGIQVTGTLTGPTVMAAKSPRCGRPDVEATHSRDNNGRAKRFVIAGSRNKWNKRSITWKINSWPTSDKISRKQVLKEIKAAFKIWSDHTPLEFIQVNNNPADVRIEFVKKRHGDDQREPPFDGRGGTLAHAFYPNSGWGNTDGDVHFDDDEIFTYKDKEIGTNLFYTAAHEVGHALGLQHSSKPEALMNAWDKGYIRGFKLPADDKFGIQSIYGINTETQSSRTEVVSTTHEPAVTTKAPSHGDCNNGRIAVTVLDGSLFIFQGDHLWRYQGEHVNQRLLTPLHGFPIRRYFKDGPKQIDAAFTYTNGSAVFIKGKNMWVFNVRTRRMVGDPGLYPMRVKAVFGIPKSIDGAFHNKRTGIIYFFKDEQLWKYDANRNELITTESITATDDFPGLPTGIHSAYSDDDGHLYFIRGQRYWEFNETTKTLQSPKLFAFLDCH